MTRDAAKRPGVAIEDGTSAVASRPEETMSKFRTHPLRRSGGQPARRRQRVRAIDVRHRPAPGLPAEPHRAGHPERPDHPQRGLSPRAGRAGDRPRPGPRPRRRRGDPAGAQPHRPHDRPSGPADLSPEPRQPAGLGSRPELGPHRRPPRRLERQVRLGRPQQRRLGPRQRRRGSRPQLQLRWRRSRQSLRLGPAASTTAGTATARRASSAAMRGTTIASPTARATVR